MTQSTGVIVTEHQSGIYAQPVCSRPHGTTVTPLITLLPMLDTLGLGSTAPALHDFCLFLLMFNSLI